MSTRIDYTQIAAKLDYASLEKKLEQLTQREPPRKRKTAADVLEPLRERLLALHRKGWSSRLLTDELKAAGIPVSPARLRECLGRWTAGANGTTRSRSRRRRKRGTKNARPSIAASRTDHGQSGPGAYRLGNASAL